MSKIEIVERKPKPGRKKFMPVRDRDYGPEEKQKIIDFVLAQTAAGIPISRTLRENEGMPVATTFWKWHFDDVDLQQKVARAREHGVEALLDEARDIVDNPNGDAYLDYDRHGKPVAKIDGEAIARSRLRAETRIKMAQMIQPRKYGAKVDITSGGDKLPANPAHIDARIQSITMMAAARIRNGQPLEGIGLGEEALKLLE